MPQVSAPNSLTPKRLRAVHLRVLLALEAGWPIVSWIALAIVAAGIVVGGLAALEKGSDRLIALPAWLAVLIPIWVAYRHRLARPIMGLVGQPRWRARGIGGVVRPLDMETIIEAERRQVMSQLPPEQGHDPGDPIGVFRRPTAAERERFEAAVNDYTANLRLYLESRAPARLAGAALWNRRVEWRHRGGQVLNNVEVVLSFPTETFRLAGESGGSSVKIKRGDPPEQPVRPWLKLQTGPHGIWYSIETDLVRITRSKRGGSRFEAGIGLPQELDLAAERRSALVGRDKIDQSDPRALRVFRTFERLRYDDRAMVEGTSPIEAAEPGFHVVEWEILADELARPITGRLLVEARSIAESGEPITDLAAPPPDKAAALRLESAVEMRAA